MFAGKPGESSLLAHLSQCLAAEGSSMAYALHLLPLAEPVGLGGSGGAGCTLCMSGFWGLAC